MRLSILFLSGTKKSILSSVRVQGRYQKQTLKSHSVMKEESDEANALEVISYLFSIRLLLENANISVR